MTGKQLKKIIDKIVVLYGGENLKDEEIDKLVSLFPFYFSDLIYDLSNSDIYIERERNKYIYFGLDEKFNYKINEEKSDIKNGWIFFDIIPKEKKNENNR